jgi:SNF2 family DNA or RNA helicase
MTNLWQHQKEALELLRKNRSFTLHMDPGTGKTACVVKWIEGHMQAQEHRALIFTPPVVCNQWLKEFEVFTNGLHHEVAVAIGSSTKKLKAISSGAKIVVTNYEAVRSKDVLKALYDFRPTILVCDESHRCKASTAKQSKEIAKLSRLAQYHCNMTGTPMTNSELDLFQQFYILDGGATFGNNFYTYRAKYFEDKNAHRRGAHNYFPDWQVRKGSREAIAAILTRRSFVVRKADCLDLPDMLYKEVEVDLSNEQAKAYNEMKNEFLTTLEDARGNPQVAVGRLVITKGLRLQQIVSGFVGVEGNDEISFKDNPRLDALEDLLTDLTKPVIVWACFRKNYEDIARVCEKLKLTYGYLVGAQNHNEREETIQAFRKGQIQVLIANQGAGGVGVNLVEAPNAIYYSRDFSLEKDIQSEARNYRGGSEIHQKVTRYDLVSKGTIDVDILKALRAKKDVLEYLLQGER